MKTLRLIGKMTSKLKIFAFVLIAVLTCVSFSSCSDDDKNEHFLIGIWVESWYDDIIELKTNGSGYYAEWIDDTEVAPFDWTYKNDMLTIIREDNEIEEARLVNQSENKIQWKHYVSNPNAYDQDVIYEDDYGYYYVWTWIRYTE